MIAGHDLAIIDFSRINVPQKEWFAVFPLHVELLIEITVVNLATPSNADRVAAHQPIDRGRIKIVDQEQHVFFKLVAVPQISGKAPNGEIGNGVKLIEHYAEVRKELALEIGLHLGLGAGQERSDGVVNQMQRKLGNLAIP